MPPHHQHMAELCSPLPLGFLPERAAFQLPVGNQPAWLVVLQPRLHGALISLPHTRLGAATANWRLSLWEAMGKAWRLSVVCGHRHARRGFSFAWRISVRVR